MKRGLAIIALILATWLPAASSSGLSDDQWRRLDRREVVLLDQLPPGGGAKGGQGGTGFILVQASPEAVWRVLVDYPGHSGLYPRVVNSEVLERDADHALVRYVVGVGPFSFAFHIHNYPDEARGRLVWRLAHERPNDLFRESWGYWQLEPRGDGVILTYAMASRTVLPAFLTRGAEREGLAETLKAVRDRSERTT